jgi:hypothetical protein
VIGALLSLVLMGAPDWPVGPSSRALEERVELPSGWNRPASGPWGQFLRTLPLLPGRPEVLLHDGRKKRNQEAHSYVVDLDVGRRDLQQCADAVIRLRAEYLWQAGARGAICFRFTSGDAASWKDYAAGIRPQVSGRRVRFVPRAKASSSRSVFRSYLDTVFTYAGSASLARSLEEVAPKDIAIGDVLLQGGFPGHAVLVVDLARDQRGRAHVLLAQSYMPAQQFHVLRRPGSPSPWYPVEERGTLRTPEWSFDWERDLRRFPKDGCP